jgi:hypothetical protein
MGTALAPYNVRCLLAHYHLGTPTAPFNTSSDALLRVEINHSCCRNVVR